jgi:hypothetical protein
MTDQELETRRFAIATLSVLLGFATLFVVAGTVVAMLAH